MESLLSGCFPRNLVIHGAFLRTAARHPTQPILIALVGVGFGADIAVK